MAVEIPERPCATLVDDDYVVTTERHLNVDATNGDVVVTIPAASCGTNRTVAKVDDSANTVTVEEYYGGTLATITTQGERKGFFSDTGAYVVR
jgi:hypothetical protein